MNSIESQIEKLLDKEEPYVGMPISGLNRNMDRHRRPMDHSDMDRHDMRHRDMDRHDMDHCCMDRHDREHYGMEHCDREHMRHDQLAGMPLAMAYVPWQCWNETYEPAEAHHRGTIFPELDLPFLGGGGDC